MIDLRQIFTGRWEGWKEALGMIDDMIEATEIDYEIMVLREVRERMAFEVDSARYILDEHRDREMIDHNRPDPERVRRKKAYGRMVGCNEALDFVRALPESETRDRTIRRMEFEFDKETPVPMKFIPGKYGKKYDNYSCGQCGKGAVNEAWYRKNWKQKRKVRPLLDLIKVG